MKLKNAIVMQLQVQKRFRVNSGEIIFTDFKDFKEVLRFLWDIKRDLYETDYKWKFDVFYNVEKLLVEIKDGRGVARNAGIEQCLDWLRRNGAEITVLNPNTNEKTSLLPPQIPSASTPAM